MIYNLLKKEATSTWEEAKGKLIKTISLNAERIGDDYIKAFPYDFNEEIHFIYEGDLTKPHRIGDDFSIYFYSERECVELGYRSLKDGEILILDSIVYVPSPGPFFTWQDSEWVYEKEIEVEFLLNEINQKETEIEKTKAKLTSRKALGMFTENIETEISTLLSEHSDLCHDLSILGDDIPSEY